MTVDRAVGLALLVAIVTVGWLAGRQWSEPDRLPVVCVNPAPRVCP